MKKPVPSSPETLQVIDETSDVLPSAQELGLLEDGCVMRQKGGRGEGLKLLPGFLHERSESYTKKCHRPLQHLTAVPVYQLILPLEHSLCERYFSPLKSAFMKLKTCHVARRENGQVLCGLFREDYVGTAILSRSWKMSRALNLRICILPMMVLEKVTLMKHIMRHGKQVKQNIRWWMRMLTATGWLNFRMRAMLMSFASYHLWLHWRKPALHLARLFTVYERASITAKLKCNRVPQASTAFVFIIRSSKVWTTIPMAHLSASGFPSWQICNRNSSIRHGKHPLK